MVVLAVNAWDESKSDLTTFAKNEKLTHKILLDGGEVFTEKYGLQGVPTTFWIDRNGVIVDIDVDFKKAGPLERKTAKLVAGAG